MGHFKLTVNNKTRVLLTSKTLEIEKLTLLCQKEQITTFKINLSAQKRPVTVVGRYRSR
jgi:hypothetical protein